MRTLDPQKRSDIIRMYQSGNFMTSHIARTFGLSVRRVSQIVKEAGVARSKAEGNRVAAQLMPRHRIRQKKRATDRT